MGGLGFCAGAATRVVGSTLPAPCCSVVGAAAGAGAGVAPPCGVGEGSAVGEADGRGVVAPEGGGAVSVCCASTGAVDAAINTSDDADNSSARLRWNDWRRYMTKA